MRTTTLIAASLLTLVLGGCENGDFPPTNESRAAERAKQAKKGDARVALFRECMALAAKMPRQSDDDVSDIVSECSSQAYYMSNYIR